MTKRLLDRPLLHLALILLLGLIAYSNTFGVPFVFDDVPNIMDNLMIRDLSNIPSLLAGRNEIFSSRPLIHVTFAVNYYFGGLDTTGYHIVNVCIHLVNGVLLYLLVLMTGRHLGYDRKDVLAVAAIASALFLIHPIQTEAINNAIHRSMLLSATFYLLGTVLFLKSVTAGERRGVYIACLFIVSLLGMGSRENFAMFPVMLLLYDLFFISRFGFRDVLKHYRAYVPVVLSLGYLAFLVLNNTYKKSTFAGSIPPADYALTQFNVFWTYVRLVLFPVNQSIDHGYQVAKTLFEFPTLLSFTGYLALLAGGVITAKKRPLPAFLLLWVLVALFPISFGVTLLDLGLDDVIFEHRLYLPGAAIMVAASLVIFMGARTVRERWPFAGKIVLPALLAVLLLLTAATHIRNGVWTDKIALWQDALGKAPLKARPHHNLGNAYAEEQSFDKAIEQFWAALKIRPDHPQTHLELAKSLKAKGLRGEAMEHLKTAILIAPGHTDAHYTIGVMYMENGDFNKAREEFMIVLSQYPEHQNARLFLEYLRGK